eukprot:TRINITY_DN16057_c0_g1_i1.p1 TRINITY_DN16057_c0_g1~~TRINITY_DN16057_c0_g1_i1.p1  ORF type:complete len:466 (-),score=43.48 TRINITY_DN16057_c0_g1_i1:35-1432(-)
MSGKGAYVLIFFVAIWVCDGAESLIDVGYMDALDETQCPPCCPPDCCPQHIGPPCPRNYDNDMPDYKPGDSTTLSDDLRKNMTTKSDEFLALILKNAPPSDPTKWPNVFMGTAGRALLFLKLYSNEKSESKKKLHLAFATQYIKTSLAHTQMTPTTSVGYLFSYIGTYTIAAIVFDLNGNFSQSEEYIKVVRDAFHSSDAEGCPSTQDYGKAGLLYAAFLLNDYFGRNVIPRDLIVQKAYQIIDTGVQHGSTSEMIWPNPAFPNILFWGEGHGSTGVLIRLLDIPEIMANATSRGLLKNTLDFLLTLQFPDGNFPTPLQPPYPGKPDVLVQWCHGAPGFMPVLTKAWAVFNDTKYLASAERAADCVWERGLLTKGLMLGHGISGNTYMFLNMYKLTQNKKYLYRAIKFQEYVLTHPGLSEVSEMRKPTPTPFMFFVGSYGSAVVLWSDMLYDIENASMPGFEVGL